MMVTNIFQIIENSNEFRKSRNLVKSHDITCIVCGKILIKFRVRRHILYLETQTSLLVPPPPVTPPVEGINKGYPN